MSVVDSPVMVFNGTIVDSSRGLPMYVRDQVIGVKKGKICFVEDANEIREICHHHGLQQSDVRTLNPGQFIMPGFVDAHLHATQYRFLGNHLEERLESWLRLYTQPNEERFTDPKVADQVFSLAVKRTLKNGTTTGVYFGSKYVDASLTLCEVAEKYGQRAFIGHLCSDNANPRSQSITTQAATETEMFIEKVLDKQVKPFDKSNPLRCTPQLLQALGEMVPKYNVPVQTHLCEIKDFTQPDDFYTFPKDANFTDILDRYNLLTEKSIMGHGVYLSKDNLKMLQERGSSVAHCPNSNISIRSGLCDVRRLLQNSVKVAIGTDMAAGYSYSMLDAIRNTILTSKVLNLLGKCENPLNYQEAFRLATLGGCKALGTQGSLGTLEVGKQFDALVVNTNIPNGPFDYFAEDTVEENIEKFLNLGDDRNIKEVYVAGKCLNERLLH